MKRLALVVVVGCGSTPSTPRVQNTVVEKGPRTDFAVAHGNTVVIAHASDTGIVVDRTVTVPARVSRMVWSGADPIVWLDFPESVPDSLPPETYPSGGPHEGELGRITQAGYDKLPQPAWRRVTNKGEQFQPPQRGLIAAPDGETWAELCEYGFTADGSWHCEDQLYARVAPTGGDVVSAAPKHARVWGTRGLPELAGPPGYTLSIAKNARGIAVLTCSGPNGRASFPSDPDDHSDGFGEPQWISLSPPIFEANQEYTGFTGWSEQRIFAGCAPAKEYTSAMIGPHDTVWLTGKKLEVYSGGKLVGQTEPGLVAFHAE